jgi:hypothetical protein
MNAATTWTEVHIPYLHLTQQTAPFPRKVAIPPWNNSFISAQPGVKLLVQPNELIYGIRRTQREYAMPYEYDLESVLANGIYPAANAIEMALLLLLGILLLSLSHPGWCSSAGWRARC